MTPLAAIVVGHNSVAQGAVRVTDGVTEFEWNNRLAGMIKSHNPGLIQVFNRVRGRGYSAEIDEVYSKVDASGAKLVVELHFNGAGDPSVKGGETLSSGSNGSMKLANIVRRRVDGVLGGPDRGVKVKKRTDRGGRSLHAGRAPAVLDEPYFGSNAESCAVADDAMDELAEAYYRSICEYLEIPIIATAPPVTAPPAVSREYETLRAVYKLVRPYFE